MWRRRRKTPGPAPSASSPDRGSAGSVAAPPALRPLLSRESSVSGKLSFEGPTRIDGHLRGDVRGTGTLVIGESGTVRGTIRVPSLVVFGLVDGDVLGAERVEIAPGGEVRGRLETRALVVHEGARLDSDCRVAPPRAAVHLLRPQAGG